MDQLSSEKALSFENKEYLVEIIQQPEFEKYATPYLREIVKNLSEFKETS